MTSMQQITEDEYKIDTRQRYVFVKEEGTDEQME